MHLGPQVFTLFIIKLHRDLSFNSITSIEAGSFLTNVALTTLYVLGTSIVSGGIINGNPLQFICRDLSHSNIRELPDNLFEMTQLLEL